VVLLCECAPDVKENSRETLVAQILQGAKPDMCASCAEQVQDKIDRLLQFIRRHPTEVAQEPERGFFRVRKSPSPPSPEDRGLLNPKTPRLRMVLGSGGRWSKFERVPSAAADGVACMTT
jgi:hypothetical protein